jgi:hypothetical protein
MERKEPVKQAQPPRTLKQFLVLLWREILLQRNWLLIPLWILLALLAVLLVLTGNPHILPAIYIAF